MSKSLRETFSARYQELIEQRAESDFGLIPKNQALGYVPIPGAGNCCESELKIRLDVAELRGSSIAWTVAEQLISATTASEAQQAICFGLLDLKLIQNFDRACAAFVLTFPTAYEAICNEGVE